MYRAIREQIINGACDPAEKLPHLRLSDALHVSRTPVREALYRLVQEGVVQVYRRRGFAVTSITAEHVRELYEIRLGLELMAVRFLARNSIPSPCTRCSIRMRSWRR